MILQALACFAFGAVLLIVAFRPLATWRVTEAWKYRHPEAVEPSETGLRVASVVYGIFAALAFVVGIALLVVESPEEREDRRAAERIGCEELAEQFDKAAVFDLRGRLEARSPVEDLASQLGLEAEFSSIRLQAGWVDLVSIVDEDGTTIVTVDQILGSRPSGSCGG